MAVASIDGSAWVPTTGTAVEVVALAAMVSKPLNSRSLHDD